MTPKNPDKSREEAGQLSAHSERDTGGGECTLSAPPGVDFDKSQTLDGGPINENGRSGRVVVDLFCGMGGFSEGARLAGVETVLAVDAWGPALAVHAENHPSSRHVCLMLGEGADGSVEAVAELILESVGRRGFHLHGSPPCQNLSNANANGDREEGMRLVNWFLKLVRFLESHPLFRSWSMEQVPTVISGLPSWVVVGIVNAADYGVPQTRRRAYAGRGWRLKPSHAGEWVSILDALPHLTGELETLIHTGNLAETNPRPLATAQMKFAVNVDGCGPTQSRRAASADGLINGPSMTLRNSRPTIRSLPVKLEASGSPGAREMDRGIEEPSKTICGGGNQVGPRLFNHAGAPERIRSLIIEETLTLQGFRADYSLDAARLKTERWTMIGNAVCPPVAQALIEGWLKTKETLGGWL